MSVVTGRQFKCHYVETTQAEATWLPHAQRYWGFCLLMSFIWFTRFGFHAAQIRVALNRCLEKRLIATPTSLKGDDYSRIRVTTVGAYTVKKLMFMFAYLDAIIVDTPIVDPNLRVQIDDIATTEERFGRALVFLAYLETQWSKLDQSAAEL